MSIYNAWNVSSVFRFGSQINRFHSDHWSDLKASGLSDEMIERSEVFSLVPRDLKLFVSENGKMGKGVISALCFPYPDDHTFARIKLFPPHVDDKGHRTKYIQPPKTGSRLYTPVKIDTKDLITIIEGEKKTLSGIQHGLNAVGIGGIWNWVDNFGYLGEDFKKIRWIRTRVDIVPDSDVWTREDLLRAVLAFSTRLRDECAEVVIVRLDPGRQKGLDDFFVAGNTIRDYRNIERVTLNSQFFDQCQRWFSRWRKEKADANICPYCNKGFKDLRRHKCKIRESKNLPSSLTI